MGIIMLIKLYTSRVLLDVLGIDDYGVWNAVAAFVIAFNFISSPLTTATQRFLNYDMGKGGSRLNELFVTSLILFIIITILVIGALETGGLWFLNHKMNFSSEKLVYVNILFQLSIFTLAINLIRMPYESAIIAEEKMSFYAVLCIIEAVLMLAIAFMVQIKWGYNKLVIYGVLNLITTFLLTLVYKVYCNRKFKYTIINKLKFDKKLIKEVGSFSGWNLFGACASMSATQGITTLINIFFGVAMNASYGISVQVQGAVRNVIQNFQKASNPQIVKSFAEGDLGRTRSLVINVCKYSFLISLLFTIPMIVNIDFILKIWLGNNVPPMANIFSCLTLILTLLVCFSGPMDTAIFASGKIKSFQITYSIIIFSNIVFAYIFFKLGAAAYWAVIIKCIIEIFIIIARLIFLKQKIQLKYYEIISSTFIPCLIISIICLCPVFLIKSFTSISGWKLLFSTSISFLCFFIPVVWLIALNRHQRIYIKSFVLSKLNRDKNSSNFD